MKRAERQHLRENELEQFARQARELVETRRRETTTIVTAVVVLVLLVELIFRDGSTMEKRTGWGAEYPDEKRNGEWEYQVFTPDRKVNEKANLNSCFECHKPHASTDFLFTADKIKAASK